MINRLQRLLEKNKRSYAKKIQEDRELLRWIDNQIPGNMELREKIYLILNPKSNVCHYGNKKTFVNIIKGYRGCGYKCQCSIEQRQATNLERYGVDNVSKDKKIYQKALNTQIERYGHVKNLSLPEFRKRVSETIEDKYGVGHPMYSEDIKEKLCQTNLKRYGVENPPQSDQVKSKIQQTNLDKYGVGSTLLVPSVREKIKNTIIERYNVDNPLSSKEVQEKIKETNLQRYGVENPLLSIDIQDKVKQTNLEKYGVENPFSSKDIQEKIKDTNFERYGVSHSNQKHIGLENIELMNNKEYMEEMFQSMSTQDIADYFGSSVSLVGKKMVELGIREKYTSSAELQIRQFLDENGIKYISNTRKIIPPLELDIFIQSKNIAIEYCGLYWHSDLYKTSKYHQEKYKQCKNKGIRLITIFEDEWLYKTHVCRSRLRHIFGINYRGPGARKLLIKSIVSKVSKSFLNNNHIQGSTPATAHYGAFDNGDLVAVMTFSKPRRAMSQKGGFELTRFSTNGFSYSGVANRLFKAFVRDYDPELITSFCDLRWGTGVLYEKLGFEFQYETHPNYWYYKMSDLIRYHRFMFTKHSIVENHNGNPNLTEIENMRNMGYHRIFDCGNSKWIWTNK